MSWLDIPSDSHFSVHNLPYGVFSRKSSGSGAPAERRIGIAVGRWVLDIPQLYYAGFFSQISSFDPELLLQPNLNAFMSLERVAWREFRTCIQALLSDNADSRLRDNAYLKERALVPLEEVAMHMPVDIGDYTDFYSSREHATNIGIMLRGKDNALQPNWLSIPIGYHGRASSVVISGTNVVRPCGQILPDQSSGPVHKPTNALDFELEMAFFIGGKDNNLGTTLMIEDAESRIFGVVLMNDWSARDVQAWEYVPLGPFTAKNFCTSISPWIVSMDALEPFRCSSSTGSIQSPEPLEYLRDPEYSRGLFNVDLEVSIRGKDDEISSIVSKSNLKYLHWNFKQQLVHHSVTGCNIRAGDLLASGTISGPTEDSFGSMMELSWKGSREVVLTNSTSSTTRKYLADGDEVTMTGFAQGNGYRVGFGEVKGKILPANSRSEQLALQVLTAHVPPPIYNIKLYSYFNSSSSHRVRIALHLKGINFEYIPIDLKPLVGSIGGKLSADITSRNPHEQIPLLEFTMADGSTGSITQSVAIIEFLEECFPHPPVLPSSPFLRARARQIAEIINSGIQPYHQLGFTRQIKTVEVIDNPGVEDKVPALINSVLKKGLNSVEEAIKQAWGGDIEARGRYAAGTSTPSVADLYIVPQIYAAKRFGVDPSPYSRIMQVFCKAETLPAFIASSPQNQIDAV